MPAPIKDIGFDEIYNPDSGLGLDTPSMGNASGAGSFSGSGGGGGSSSQNNNQSTTQSATTSNVFVFNISSNQTAFVTDVNGSTVPNNKLVRITRESLASENKIIRISKQGFSNNNDYYVVEMVDDGAPIIKNPNINQPLGISTKDIVLTKYVNGQVFGLPKSIKNDTSIELELNLTKLKGGDVYEEPTKYKATFGINGKGSPVSVLKNANKNAEFFPKVGTTEYEDVDGTAYTIRSSDLTLYRITNILYTSINGQKEVVANSGESLELDITLNSNFSFDIITEEVKQAKPALDPQIKLYNGSNSRTYNRNSKAGVPILLEKNKDVRAVTIIVGDDILEFDDLDKGDIFGITIPHNVFDKIGKYNIKIFPFSFDDYEQQVRPAEKAAVIEKKKVEEKYVVKEEVKPTPIEPKDKVNPYKPQGGPVGGGGGGRGIVMFDEQETQNLNPFTNRGDFVDRPINDRNIR